MNIIMEDKKQEKLIGQAEKEIKANNINNGLSIIGAIISAISTILVSMVTIKTTTIILPLIKIATIFKSEYVSLFLSGIGVIAGATIGIVITYKMFQHKSEQQRINIVKLHEKESDLFRSIESDTDKLLEGNSNIR